LGDGSKSGILISKKQMSNLDGTAARGSKQEAKPVSFWGKTREHGSTIWEMLEKGKGDRTAITRSRRNSGGAPEAGTEGPTIRVVWWEKKDDKKPLAKNSRDFE